MVLARDLTGRPRVPVLHAGHVPRDRMVMMNLKRLTKSALAMLKEDEETLDNVIDQWKRAVKMYTSDSQAERIFKEVGEEE